MNGIPNNPLTHTNCDPSTFLQSDERYTSEPSMVR